MNGGFLFCHLSPLTSTELYNLDIVVIIPQIYILNFAFLFPKGKLCGSAGEILYGQYIYTGVEFGDKATAVCDDG